jgi:hypothetical protein
MRIEEIKIPIYVGTLVLIQVDNLEELDGKYSLKVDKGCNYGAFTFQENSKFYIAFPNEEISNSLICHESVHITNMLFKYICMKPDFDNDEPQAYFTEWVFEQVERFIKNTNML